MIVSVPYEILSTCLHWVSSTVLTCRPETLSRSLKFRKREQRRHICHTSGSSQRPRSSGPRCRCSRQPCGSRPILWNPFRRNRIDGFENCGKIFIAFLTKFPPRTRSSTSVTRFGLKFSLRQNILSVHLIFGNVFNLLGQFFMLFVKFSLL